MHYSWSTEARARRALANVSALLRPGGTFIGTMPDANVIIKKLREGLPFLIKHAEYKYIDVNQRRIGQIYCDRLLTCSFFMQISSHLF